MSAIKVNVYDYIKRAFIPHRHSKEDLKYIAEHSLRANFIREEATIVVRDDGYVLIDVRNHSWIFGPFLTTLEIMEDSIEKRGQIPKKTSG